VADYSVVVPAFNAATSIEQAVGSAWTAGADDVVVVDDGSTDNTASIAESLGCRVIRQSNRGAAQARRTGIGQVRTRLVTLLDADDELLPAGARHSCLMAARLLQAGSDFSGILGTSVTGDRPFVHWPEGVSPESLLERCRAPGPPGAFVWSRDKLLNAMDDAPTALLPRYAEDYELLIRTTRHGAVHVHDVPTCRYSATGGKSTHDPAAGMICAESIRRHYAREFGIPIRFRSPSELRAMSHFRDAFAAQAAGDHGRWARGVGMATLNNPFAVARMAARRALRKHQA
jgi:glycosyltransferase involved in cell wall biosynthesis